MVVILNSLHLAGGLYLSNNNMRNIVLSAYLLMLIPALLVGCKSKPVKLYPLSPFESTGLKTPGTTEKYKIKYYYVEHFKDNKRKELAELVLQNLEKDFAEFESYDVYIYKKTETLNESFISSLNKDDIADYMDDIIFICSWSKGEFFACIELDDGNVLRNGTKLIEK
jgi:hypothetical protein